MAQKYLYEIDPKGHVWRLDEDGEIDTFAFEYEYHNGPQCTVCDYIFCVHCITKSQNIETCPGAIA